MVRGVDSAAAERFPYGAPHYTLEDLAGQRWSFTQSIADVDPGQWGGVLREDILP
jgi:hypothetical protein